MADKLLFKFGQYEIRQSVGGGNWVCLIDSVTNIRIGTTYVAQSSYPKWAKTKCKARKKSLEKQIARLFRSIQFLESEFICTEKCEEEIEKSEF